MRLTLLALACLLVGGCQPLAQHSPEQEGPYGTIVYDNFAPRVTTRAPLYTALRAPSGPQHYRALRLVLELERRVPVGAEVTVQLELPRGVRLTAGSASTRLQRNVSARRDELAFELDVGPTPQEDLKVVVDARGPHFGYHAVHPDRFGRPAPLPEAPEARGRELEVAGKTFGRSIVVE